MTKVKLNINQTHCCGIYSDKTVYSFTAGSYPELFYLLQRRGLIESFIDGDFIVYDELRKYSDLPPYQKLTAQMSRQLFSFTNLFVYFLKLTFKTIFKELLDNGFEFIRT